MKFREIEERNQYGCGLYTLQQWLVERQHVTLTLATRSEDDVVHLRLEYAPGKAIERKILARDEHLLKSVRLACERIEATE